jgi:hypothetical protein
MAGSARRTMRILKVRGCLMRVILAAEKRLVKDEYLKVKGQSKDYKA